MKLKKTNVVVVFSSHLGVEKNNEFIAHIHKTIGCIHSVICHENYNEFSLSELYSKDLAGYNSGHRPEHEQGIMVFCHPDIKFKTKNWGRILLNHFNNTNYGILGLAGTTYLGESAMWWEDRKTMYGIVNHTDGEREWESRFSPPIQGVQPVVTIDGVFIAVDPGKLEYGFDTNFGKFHFYDLGFCVPNYLEGVDLGVISTIRIVHSSVGMTNDDWESNRVKFAEQYKDELPLALEPIIKELNITKFTATPKVSVIIPTKNNFDILNKNIMSWKQYVKYPKYEILIADTGSDPEVKEKYKEIIGLNIKLVEYDYFNFGQINNDMVKNHTPGSELILFCNDDICLLNDALSRCVEIYNETKSPGTIGIRLHYENGTIQHNGIVYFEDKDGNLHLTHKDMTKSANYSTGVQHKSHGNTGAFMLINKSLFLELGCFNEEYIECFEDAELNLKCRLKRKQNITVSDAVAYHYESLSRNKDPRKLEKLNIDYQKRLHPFWKENKEALRKLLK